MIVSGWTESSVSEKPKNGPAGTEIVTPPNVLLTAAVEVLNENVADASKLRPKQLAVEQLLPTEYARSLIVIEPATPLRVRCVKCADAPLPARQWCFPC